MSKKKILVVDDEETARITLEALLTKEGHDITLAENGNEAIEKIRQNSFDIALVDLVMPDMDGMEVLNEIKRIRPETHVIMITGFGTIESAVESVKKGAAYYVSKPFKKNEIENIIRRVLEEARFERRLKVGEEVEDGFEIFKNLVTHGAPGLCITKQSPEIVREKYGLKEISIIQLTGLDELRSSINNFTQENDNAVVLIDGIEQLITQSSIGTIKKFVSDLNNSLSLSNSRAILLYDPKKVDVKVLKDFMRVITGPYTSLISEILSDNLRRDVIRFLWRSKGSAFTTILQEMNVKDPPKLSFHLRKLKSAGIIEQDSERRYFLTERGEKVHGLLRRLDGDAIKDLRNILWLRSG